MIGWTPLEEDIRARITADGAAVAAVIGQLAAAQAFLATHDAPVSKDATAVICGFCRSQAQVDQVAAAIGAAAGWNPQRTWYSARRPFGANLAYAAVYVAGTDAA